MTTTDRLRARLARKAIDSDCRRRRLECEDLEQAVGFPEHHAEEAKYAKPAGSV